MEGKRAPSPEPLRLLGWESHVLGKEKKGSDKLPVCVCQPGWATAIRVPKTGLRHWMKNEKACRQRKLMFGESRAFRRMRI